MTKTEFLERLRSGWAKLEGLLAEVGEARMTQPGVAGVWSVKDVIAHVTWFEREMVGVLRAKALVGSEWWGLPQDERNAAVFEQNRGRALADVLAEARAAHQQLVEAVEALSDDDLNDPRRFADMPADWIPWEVVEGNSFGHYPDHISTIRAWLPGKDHT